MNLGAPLIPQKVFNKNGGDAVSNLVIGAVAACFPTYRPVHKGFVRAFQSRVMEVLYPSDSATPGVGLDTERLHTNEMLGKFVSSQRK